MPKEISSANPEAEAGQIRRAWAIQNKLIEIWNRFATGLIKASQVPQHVKEFVDKLKVIGDNERL